MKKQISENEYMDVFLSNTLSVVEKAVSKNLSHTTYLYVYEGDKTLYVVSREITSNGVKYFKETF